MRICQQQDRIDDRKVGICGHSVGGLVASLVAADESAGVAFLVLMASPGVSGEEILYRQAELVMQASGAERGSIERNDMLQRKMFSVVKNEEDPAVATTKVRDVIALHIDNASDEEKELFEQQAGLLDAQLQLISTPWFRWFLIHEPAPVLANVKCPVLAINGERDLQVDPRQNLPVISEPLAAAGHTRFLVKEFPKLNHLYNPAGGVNPVGGMSNPAAASPLAVAAESQTPGAASANSQPSAEQRMIPRLDALYRSRTRKPLATGEIPPSIPYPNHKAYKQNASGAITHVKLDSRPATDDDLAQLSAFPALEELILTSTDVTDAGVAHLTKLKTLKNLQLLNTSISDRSVPYLKQMTQLEVLNLGHTWVSQSGRDELKAALPNCELHWSNVEQVREHAQLR